MTDKETKKGGWKKVVHGPQVPSKTVNFIHNQITFVTCEQDCLPHCVPWSCIPGKLNTLPGQDCLPVMSIKMRKEEDMSYLYRLLCLPKETITLFRNV